MKKYITESCWQTYFNLRIDAIFDDALSKKIKEINKLN